MQTIKKLSPSEVFAVNQWLSDSPCDLSYEEIIECLINESYYDLDVVPWEVVEDYDGKSIAEFIEDTRMAFERATQSEALI